MMILGSAPAPAHALSILAHFPNHFNVEDEKLHKFISTQKNATGQARDMSKDRGLKANHWKAPKITSPQQMPPMATFVHILLKTPWSRSNLQHPMSQTPLSQRTVPWWRNCSHSCPHSWSPAAERSWQLTS